MEIEEIEEEVWARVWVEEEGECTAAKEWVVEVVTCKEEAGITSEQDMAGEEDLGAQWVKVTSLGGDEEHLVKEAGNKVDFQAVREDPAIDHPALDLIVREVLEHPA